jgi:hypothetical protein
MAPKKICHAATSDDETAPCEKKDRTPRGTRHTQLMRGAATVRTRICLLSTMQSALCWQRIELNELPLGCNSTHGKRDLSCRRPPYFIAEFAAAVVIAVFEAHCIHRLCLTLRAKPKVRDASSQQQQQRTAPAGSRRQNTLGVRADEGDRRVGFQLTRVAG